MLVVDIFSRFDGNPGTIYPVINYIGNFLIYLLNPILPSIWLLYVHLQIFHDEKKTRRWLYSLLAVNAGNIVMLVLSQFFGWFYYIDPNNIYHRGWLFWLPVSITVTLTLAAFVLVALNRKNIEKKYLFALVFFPIPPFVCVILQIIFYGIPLMLNSVAFSLLIVSFYIQNRSMNTDYLTGVSNRKRLETYMREKINTSTEDKTFSAILIDLDDFKFINDTFGHDIGDYVLGTLVKLLKSCLRSGDFIARFGGDEFYIILDVSNRDALEATVYRINNCIEKYNECANKPYKLGLSMGYSVYDYNSHMKVEDFQKHIDILMYENKRASKNEL
jgi:diguanylate cyclase (GGDEF)-like protein